MVQHRKNSRRRAARLASGAWPGLSARAVSVPAEAIALTPGSEQGLRLGLGRVERLLRVAVAGQDGVHRVAEYVLDLGILRDARAVLAVAVLEALGDHRQVGILGQEVGVLQRRFADVARGTLQVQLLLDRRARDPLDVGPGRLLLGLVDVGVDREAPAAHAVGRAHPGLHRGERDAGLADHLRHRRVAVAGGPDRPALHVGDEALAEALLAPAPVELDGTGRGALVEQALVALEALDVGRAVDRGLAVPAQDRAA